MSFAVTFIWCLIWFITITDDPIDSKCVSTKDKEAIKADRIITDQTADIPLMKLITSVPVVSLIIVGMSNDYGYNMLFTDGPNFISNVYKKNIADVLPSTY